MHMHIFCLYFCNALDNFNIEEVPVALQSQYTSATLPCQRTCPRQHSHQLPPSIGQRYPQLQVATWCINNDYRMKYNSQLQPCPGSSDIPCISHQHMAQTCDQILNRTNNDDSANKTKTEEEFLKTSAILKFVKRISIVA